ncbi:MAG: N-acetylmuramoyl-L-alanine amidase family protein [Armatimonadota bacterium]|nr:N-acetylmuramoyl-L-alanine amidase family protein [Armatimonadota bacterium]MDR5696469.1 N-acetylmuramoyl-L-alanine amidase family protein [Armatimonadota bacterium]
MARFGALIFIAALALGVRGAPAFGQAGPRIVVNGEELRLDPPAAFRRGVLFAPIDNLFAPYGASARWDLATRTAEVQGGRDVRVQFRANDTHATVNGELRPLPSPAVVVDGRLLVPVEFAYQALGAWVRWEAQENTLHVASQVLRLVFERGLWGLRLQIEATGPVRARTVTLAQPDRVVIDLLNAVSRIQTRETALQDGGIQRVRIAQFQTKPYVTRIVLDVETPLEAEVGQGSGHDLVVTFRPPRASTSLAPPTDPPRSATPALVETVAPLPPPPGPLPGHHDVQLPTPPPATPPGPAGDTPRILEVVVQREVGRIRVVVHGDRPLQYRVHELPEPDRLILDLPAVFVPVKQEIPVGGPIEVVRAAQFQADPNIARIVLQWRQRTSYQISAEEGGARLVIAVEDEPASVVRGRHVVAIDPGHGGKDPGAIGVTGLVEKDVVLDVSLRVRTVLARAGVRTVMTREADIFVDLADRVPIALRAGATVFVSVHANSNTRGVIRGSETYYLKPSGLPLATAIQEEMGRSLGIPDRGVRSANFKVLRDAPIPAALVEIGYLSNLQDEALLRTPSFRQLAAEAIGRGILRFLTTAPPPQP